MTNLSKRIALFAAVVAAAAAFASPASAQATRTFVSGVGNDADPCSRTAPCRTFAGAIIKTAPGGEINCLDPGGYGGLTINKSISIICTYTEGGSLVAGAGVNGITVNAGATDSVFLRGIDFHGATTATNGLRILAGGAVHIQDSVIRRFNAASGLGIRIAPSGATKVTITNTTIADNGSGATGGGILIQPTGSGTARVTLRDVLILNNAGTAFKVDTTGNPGAGIVFNMEDVAITGSPEGISVNVPPATTGVIGFINNITINNITGTGIAVTGGSVAIIRTANSTITDNGTGVNPGTATMTSFGNNRLFGNTTNGSFTGAIIPGA